MFCKICRKELVSNRHFRYHILSDHQVSPADYFKRHPDATKYCSQCKKELPIGEFYLDNNRPIGYRTQCIHCMRPGSTKDKCPLCHRVFQRSGVIGHLQKTHGILPIVSYQIYLKGKYCARCKTVKPLDQFYRLKNDVQVYSTYCRVCNYERIKQAQSRKRES
jgi:hypothetical protein